MYNHASIIHLRVVRDIVTEVFLPKTPRINTISTLGALLLRSMTHEYRWQNVSAILLTINTQLKAFQSAYWTRSVSNEKGVEFTKTIADITTIKPFPNI